MDEEVPVRFPPSFSPRRLLPVLAAAVGLLAAQPSWAAVFNPETFTLANGIAYVEAALAAGLDVDAFALQNAFEVNYGAGADVVALLNAGASATNVNIVSNGQSLFTRDISLGGNAYTEAIQRELNLPFDTAELAKKGYPVEGHTFDDVRPVLQAVNENVLLEIQKTFDFYRATAASDHIDRIVLSGGASAVDGFAEALADRFNLPVEYFDPFRQVAVEKAQVMDLNELAATAAVAVYEPAFVGAVALAAYVVPFAPAYVSVTTPVEPPLLTSPNTGPWAVAL